MPALSWIRFARRIPGLVRQPELPNLEALIDAERDRQPAYSLYILSIAVPACIATFGGLSVFFAWVFGNPALPLVLGTAATALLSGAAWLIFYRLYRSLPQSTEQLRKAVAKFSEKYASIGNVFSGEHVLTEDFGLLLDEAAAIYLRHCSDQPGQSDEATENARAAIRSAMTQLVDLALTPNRPAQDTALQTARPILEELRLLDATLKTHNQTNRQLPDQDPLTNLRQARQDLDNNLTAQKELEDHLTNEA